MDMNDRARQIDQLRRWSRLMDSAYRVPGTQVRFGWDPVVGLVPGLGDFATASFSALILYRAFRLGVPRVVLIRMVLNILIDLVAGAVPLVGDLFDVAWRSNSMNFALLERHEQASIRPTSADWAVVLLAFVVVGGVVILVVLSAVWMFYMILRPFLLS
jgi:hypothetical protein